MPRIDHSGLAEALEQFGMPRPEVELPFHPKRKWRFDLAWPDRKVAIEIQGGIWSRGRHTRGKGYLNDMEKLNEAQLLGWKVFWTATDHWKTGEAIDLVERILGQFKAQDP